MQGSFVKLVHNFHTVSW